MKNPFLPTAPAPPSAWLLIMPGAQQTNGLPMSSAVTKQAPTANEFSLTTSGENPRSKCFATDYVKGPDYSKPNQRRFRQWLKAYYVSDEALRKAWGDKSVTLENAQIPRPVPGRFPMHGVKAGENLQFFYDLPAEQGWADYSRYASDLTADQIIAWAKLVKKETGGRKLNAFFYGYTFELPGSFNNHYALRRVLDCPEVDVLASPISYYHRNIGDTGPFMSPVDSETAHGKLRINEEDTPSSLIDLKKVLPGVRPFLTTGALRIPKDLPDTLGILDRNFAWLMIHRAGAWYLDVTARGAFNHPKIWTLLKNRMDIYRQVYDSPRPFRPEVALIADEQSKFFVKSDWSGNYWSMMMLRNACAASGASVGYYLLDDFIAGVVPQCKVYVFACTYHLSDQQIAAIRARLDREGSTAVWIYAPGIIGAGGMDVKRSSQLTGMNLAIKEGNQGSKGTGLLAGDVWGPALEPPEFSLLDRPTRFIKISPRLTVVDPQAQPLGHYTDDNSVSSAETKSGKHRSVFFGDVFVSPQALRGLMEKGGGRISGRGTVRRF